VIILAKIKKGHREKKQVQELGSGGRAVEKKKKKEGWKLRK